MSDLEIIAYLAGKKGGVVKTIKKFMDEGKGVPEVLLTELDGYEKKLKEKQDSRAGRRPRNAARERRLRIPRRRRLGPRRPTGLHSRLRRGFRTIRPLRDRLTHQDHEPLFPIGRRLLWDKNDMPPPILRMPH